MFFPGIPLLLCGLQQLLQSPDSFDGILKGLREPLIKLGLLLPLWFFLHHLCAGIRHLLLDLQIGLALTQARASSRWVLIIGFILTVASGVLLW